MKIVNDFFAIFHNNCLEPVRKPVIRCGNLSAIITNQDCVILPGENGKCYAELPLTKTWCEIGSPTGELKQEKVVLAHMRISFANNTKTLIRKNSLRFSLSDVVSSYA